MQNLNKTLFESITNLWSTISPPPPPPPYHQQQTSPLSPLSSSGVTETARSLITMDEYNNISNIINNSIIIDDDDSAANISMDNLYPALVQCFAIIICGYLAGRFKIISNAETKGLNTFAGTFALPSLIFLSLVELNWHTVNWSFLLAILIAKSIVFFSVAIISLLVCRPLNCGRTGILATFCTQSNDFAIGYPIVIALYDKIHPEYASYLYLLAPISLAILNPISYVLMEISNSTKPTDISQERRQSIACPQMMVQTNNSQNSNNTKPKWVMFVKTMRSIILNPILLMTVFGVAGGFAFPNGLPEVISGVLRVFGNSFSATALFLLGLHMVGKTGELSGAGFLIPGVLILVKLLVLPLVTRQTVNIMNAGGNFSDTTDLSTFGFLYGTFPAAPGVFVIASQYHTDVDLIAASMVACTFISGPLMFISAKMISLTNLNPADFLNELDRFAFDISIAAIVACCWILLLFGLTKRFKRIPQRITCCLVISQLIGCVGVILWSIYGNVPGWTMYLQFSLFTIGSYSCRLWTAILAIALLFLQCRSLCFVLKLWPIFIGVAWGIPTALVAGLLFIDRTNLTPTEKRNPNFQYGNAQAAITVFLLVMCFIVTVGCLVLHQRYKKRFEKYLTLSKEVSQDTETLPTSDSTVNLLPGRGGDGLRSNQINSNPNVNFAINANIRRRRDSATIGIENEALESSDSSDSLSENEQQPTIINSCGMNSGEDCCTRKSTGTTVIDIEDLLKNHRRNNNNNNNNGTGGNNSTNCSSGTNDENVTSTDVLSDGGDGGDFTATNRYCSSQFNCDGASRRNCQNIIQNYQSMTNIGLEPLEYPENIDEHQTMRHIVLLILLLCSMFVSLALSIWTLVMEGMSGIYVELSFLDGFLSFGQSLIVLACFITDTGDLLLPLRKYWRKLWYGANVLKLPDWNSLTDETVHICDQFTTHHLDSCRKAIANDKRWRLKVYKKVFYGKTFVDWLIEVGLAKDRIEAIQYAKHLIDGRILRHINNVHHFNDTNLLYTFCSRL